MAVFQYTALSVETSDHQSGTLVADSPRQAREQLRTQGLLVELLDERKPQSASVIGAFTRRSHPTAVSEVIRELATLSHAGIPLTDALATLIRQHSGATRQWIMQLRDRIEQGSSMAEAMREQPRVFDRLSVSMVQVGENAGNLEEVLSILADFAEKSLAFRNRLFSALLYPALVFVAAIAVSIFLMTSVVPMLLTSLVEAGQDLPWSTQVLKNGSDLLLEYGWILVAVSTLSLVAALFYLSTTKGRQQWHQFLLGLPLIGRLAFQQTMSRTAFVISTLLNSGLELTRAMSIAAETCENVIVSKELRKVQDRITTGEELGPAFEASSVFPPLVVQIFAVGQQSGQLESMLSRLSQDYEQQVETLSSRLATILEPITIVFLTGIVGFILMATILPILEAGNAL